MFLSVKVESTTKSAKIVEKEKSQLTKTRHAFKSIQPHIGWSKVDVSKDLMKKEEDEDDDDENR